MAQNSPVWFTEESGKRVAEAVRRLEAQFRNLKINGRAARSFDNEFIIDGVASAACNAGGHGTMVPELAGSDPITYFNPLGDIEGGSNIVIAFSHRSGEMPERDSSGTPTPWILISAGCDSSELRFGRPRGTLWLVGVL